MIDASRETLLKGKALFNGTAHFQNENNCLNTYIYFYLEMSGGLTFNLYLNVVHFFNTSEN
jgi:hypothetical protein